MRFTEQQRKSTEYCVRSDRRQFDDDIGRCVDDAADDDSYDDSGRRGSADEHVATL